MERTLRPTPPTCSPASAGTGGGCSPSASSPYWPASSPLPGRTVVVLAMLFGVQLVVAGIFRFVAGLATDDKTGAHWHTLLMPLNSLSSGESPRCRVQRHRRAHRACQRFARNCATRNPTPAREAIRDSASDLGGCAGTWGPARRCEPPAHRWCPSTCRHRHHRPSARGGRGLPAGSGQRHQLDRRSTQRPAADAGAGGRWTGTRSHWRRGVTTGWAAVAQLGPVKESPPPGEITQ
jgi:hypothetical protein